MVERIPAGVDIGHVHLKVADLERALGFYHGVLGFDLVQRIGDTAAFLSAGGYHHHIGLNTWESRGGSPPPRGTTGLYHFAIRFPERRDLGRALRRLLEAGIPLEGASDHGVSEALYLRDPGRQRPRALLGPPSRALAERGGRPSEHVHCSTRSERLAGRSEGGDWLRLGWAQLTPLTPWPAEHASSRPTWRPSSAAPRRDTLLGPSALHTWLNLPGEGGARRNRSFPMRKRTHGDQTVRWQFALHCPRE